MRTRIRHFAQLMSLSLAMSFTLATSQSPPVHAKTSTTKPPDGTVVSKKLIALDGSNRLINIYKIFYMSAGQKVEAFVSEPKSPGKYPLLIELHGGMTASQPSMSHYNFGFAADSMTHASENVVIVEPQYRGYMESDGTVHGLAGDTIDAENAIKAAMSLGNISPGSVYALGVSMGGGVALNLASERRDVKAVVTISPFVGWDEIFHWLDTHPKVKSPDVIHRLREQTSAWEVYLNKHPVIREQNFLLDRIPYIHAPVLFLQGTGDDLVIWQTVQEFANDMNKAHKTVGLVLYPGGNHGLSDKYQGDSIDELVNWFYKYGLTDPWG